MSIRVDSLLLVQQLENNANERIVNQSYIQDALNKLDRTLSIADSAMIMLRSAEKLDANCDKIISHTKDIDKYAKAIRAEDKSKRRLLIAERAKLYDNCNKILDLYISQFSVCDKAELLGASELFFNRFSIVKELLINYNITNNQLYMNEAKLYISRLKNTSQKILDSNKLSAEFQPANK